MARGARLHVPNGLYFVGMRAEGDKVLFACEADVVEFERILTRSLRATHCKVHAFCWRPGDVSIAVQVANIELGRFVQHLTSHFARHVNVRLGSHGQVFEERYRALVIQRSTHLLDLIRYIHLLAPEPDGNARRRWCSHAAYADDMRVPWLTTYVARGMLKNRKISDRVSYVNWMAKAQTPSFVVQMKHGGFFDRRVIGTRGFVGEVVGKTFAPTDLDRVRIEKIIATVAFEHGVTVTNILSPSRRRRHVLARAVIAWRATQSGAASLAKISARLRRDPSTMWSAIERHRIEEPELFVAAE